MISCSTSSNNCLLTCALITVAHAVWASYPWLGQISRISPCSRMCHLWCLCGVVQLVSFFFFLEVVSLTRVTWITRWGNMFWPVALLIIVKRAEHAQERAIEPLYLAIPLRMVWRCSGFSIPVTLHESLVILDSKSRPCNQCNRWGKPKSTRIFSHSNVAYVETCGFRVGNAHEYLVRLSVTTRTCWFTFPNDIDKKSIADSFIGSLIRLGTMLPVISPPGSFATNELATKIFILPVNTEVDNKF